MWWPPAAAWEMIVLFCGIIAWFLPVWAGSRFLHACSLQLSLLLTLPLFLNKWCDQVSYWGKGLSRWNKALYVSQLLIRLRRKMGKNSCSFAFINRTIDEVQTSFPSLKSFGSFLCVLCSKKSECYVKLHILITVLLTQTNLPLLNKYWHWPFVYFFTSPNWIKIIVMREGCMLERKGHMETSAMGTMVTSDITWFAINSNDLCTALKPKWRWPKLNRVDCWCSPIAMETDVAA